MDWRKRAYDISIILYSVGWLPLLFFSYLSPEAGEIIFYTYVFVFSYGVSMPINFYLYLHFSSEEIEQNRILDIYNIFLFIWLISIGIFFHTLGVQFVFDLSTLVPIIIGGYISGLIWLMKGKAKNIQKEYQNI